MAKITGGGNASEMIKQVIAELDAQIGELAGQRAQLAKMVSGVVAAAAPAVRRRGRPPGAAALKAGKAGNSGKPGKKRQFSAATKAKLKAAAKARWARHRAEQKAAGKAA